MDFNGIWLALSSHDLKLLIEVLGLAGLFLLIFLESGMLVGFFFPGDSVLFTAGILASQGVFDIYILTIGCFIAAVAGDTIGYFIGQKFGRKLFEKQNSIIFRRDHLVKAEEFYHKHGGKTIILARFIPVIRAFAPVVAGIGAMSYPKFLAYNLVGGFLWAVCITLLGFYLGSRIENIDRYLIPLVGLIILISISPAIIHLIKDEKSRQALLKLLTRSK